MPLQQLIIENMGAKGLNTDVSPWALPPEYITNGNNFRIFANRIQSTGSNELWTTPPASFDAGFVMYVIALTANYWMSCGRSAVSVYDGTTHTVISSIEGYANIALDGEYNWTGCMLGSIPIINNPAIYPEYWSPQGAGQVMQRLEFLPGSTWQDVNKSFKIIRSHNNFLFALDLVESGVELPTSYRWSHPAANNGLPFTWDETDLSSLASIEQIGGDGGRILDGLSLRESFCIYSERAINILDFTGDEFVWRRRSMPSKSWLLNRNCIVEANGAHYFLSDGDVIRNDGNSITSIAHNRIRRRLNSQISSDFFDRSFVVHNAALKEIWFCVPEGTSQYPNVAYVYNWLDDSWAIQQLPNNISFADYGQQSVPPTTWDTVPGTWASTTLTWGSQTRTPKNDTIIGIDATTSELVLLDPIGNNTGIDTSSSIERTDYPLNGHREVTTITRVYPHMTGTEPVNIQIGSQQHAGGPVNWSQTLTFNPASDRKIDVRSTGEFHAWRISSIGTGNWSISGMTVEFTGAGKR